MRHHLLEPPVSERRFSEVLRCAGRCTATRAARETRRSFGATAAGGHDSRLALRCRGSGQRPTGDVAYEEVGIIVRILRIHGPTAAAALVPTAGELSREHPARAPDRHRATEGILRTQVQISVAAPKFLTV